MGTELFPKQLHSRNDLREWNAIFRKENNGAATTSIKIDPHFLRDSDHFVLSHDEPLPWQHRRNHYDRYSTLDDVLQYFQSPPTFVHGRAIDIALCFKAAPQPLCNNNDDKEAQKWMQMAEHFFERANQVVDDVRQQFDIQLSFILDGDAKPCRCLAGKFLPWNSTWIDTDECSIDCYTSNKGFCERFVILNDPARSNWTTMSAPDNHYGKFGGNTHQTLQLWEPDSQQEISDLMNTYMKGRNKGVPSGRGLKFAINMDVAMFDVFTGRVLNGTDQARGFNVLVDDHDTQHATMPSLVYESPGEMTLYYDAPGNVTFQKQRKRQLSFSPFTEIHVGPPEGSKKTENNKVQRDLGSDYISPLHSVYNDTYGTHIYDKFGDLLVASWSKKDIGEYSFLFVAVEGKVYASTKLGKTDFTDFRIIGLGTSVHASSLVDTLLLVTEGNNCYNSHIHNTQAAPLVCRPQTNPILHACEYAIDYSVGVAENWFRWLQRTQAVITPCNEFILHGALTAGRNPSGALFPLDAKARLEGKVGIMVASETYPLLEESKCGTPFMGESGIIVAAFASTVVMDLDTDSVRYLDTTATKSDLVGLMQLKAGIAVSFFVCSFCWLFLLWKQKRPRNSYVSIN